jgi:coenzyme F420 hydrogenase subunit beta
MRNNKIDLSSNNSSNNDVNYPDLYKKVYGSLPDNWLVGHVEKVRTGHAVNDDIRSKAASGGVLTQTLIYLLENNLVDSVIVAKQGVPTPEKASAVIASTREEILACAGSVYIPVVMLDILDELDPNKRYAITCLPEESASLRIMQQDKDSTSMQIKYVLGPYTGTALDPEAISCYLKSKNISTNDPIVSLKWRAGEWPGYLEVITKSGKVIRTPKVYYNFLIPFFVTDTSLQSMDFVNEFADLAVGDAWSPVFEKLGGGHSVVVTRNNEMESIITNMCKEGLLELKEEEILKASDMHGHMLDFKKRGGWLRNEWKRKLGKEVPDYGYRPKGIPFSRVLVEVIISSIFIIGRTKLARWIVSKVPESVIGPIFNFLRLNWKKLSRPTKRKGLANFEVEITKKRS